jgi:leucine dehydrogenase
MFDNAAYDSHEAVHLFADEASGLQAIIAIHSTVLGPAAGGCRAWHYTSSGAAVTDALRLARSMSLKNALADLPLGGGKAVLLQPSGRALTPETLMAFGRAVDSLEGRYITGEDVGTRVADMQWVARSTDYVSGLAGNAQLAGGDPSPKTALGVFLSIKEAWRYSTGSAQLKGVRIAVQGVGGVGEALCRLLSAEGAALTIADVNSARCVELAREIQAKVESPTEILSSDVDIVAPCALGGVLEPEQIVKLRARVVCGAANNQLASAEDGQLLRARGVLYAPDYVVNAGGIISAAAEYLQNGSEADVRARIERIPRTLRWILEIAHSEGVATSEVADRLALQRIEGVRQSRAAVRLNAVQLA